MTMKQLLKYGLAVMTTLLALAALWQFHTAVAYVLVSLMLAAALRPLVSHLAKRTWVVRVAWILLYLLVAAGLGFLLFLAAEAAIQEIQQSAQTVAAQDAWRLPAWLEGTAFQQALVTRLPPPSQIFEAVTGSQGQFVLPAILGFAQGFGGLVSTAFIIMALSIYWSINQAHFERLWLSLLPSGQRQQTRDIWRTIESDIGAYIRSQLLLCLLGGLVLGLGYRLLGSPYPALLALAGALACLVPVVGAALAIIPPLLAGLLTSAQQSVFTVLYALGVLAALGFWLKPKLFNRPWDNHILTVVLLIVLADAFGLVGIIVAPLLSIVCQILWDRLVTHRAVSGAAAQISDLVERQERVREAIREMGEPPLTLLTSSMARLSSLIAKAEPVVQGTLPAEPVEPILPLAPSVQDAAV